MSLDAFTMTNDATSSVVYPDGTGSTFDGATINPAESLMRYEPTEHFSSSCRVVEVECQVDGTILLAEHSDPDGVGTSHTVTTTAPNIVAVGVEFVRGLSAVSPDGGVFEVRGLWRGRAYKPEDLT